MKTIIKRDNLLLPLQQVIGAVERRQTVPILGNVLVKAEKGKLTVTATDLEIEVVSLVATDTVDDFQITIPARKLLDICKALPEGSDIELNIEDTRISLVCGRSRFSLSLLPAKDFPRLDDLVDQESFDIPKSVLKKLLDKTAFAMAQQDVRYYLNGILLELTPDTVRLVATDGHRLALSEYKTEVNKGSAKQIIIPRKGVLELSRLLDTSSDNATVTISQNHIRVQTEQVTFTSKLIDGKFPDYNRVIPVDSNRIMEANRELLKHSMNRIAILSNEKYRGIRLTLTEGNLVIQANNPDQEEAEEALTVSYNEANIDIGFNVTYLIDVLNVLNSEHVQLKLKDSNSSCIITDREDSSSVYVVMPMRL